MSLLSNPAPETPPNTEEPVDPAPAQPQRRIPNLGHALLFVGFAFVLLVFFQLLLSVFGEQPASATAGAVTVQHPKLQIATLAFTYLTTLLAAWLIFPLMWHRGFFDGIRWHWSTARHQAARLIGVGLLLGAMMQIVTNFITPPKTLPIDQFFASQTDAWIITCFGTIVAPIFEEIAFRGFLVPAFAIAYDWLSLPRTDAARAHWQTTTSLSPLSLVFSTVLTSTFFAMLHAEQVSHLWAALLVLFSISVVLTVIRVRTQSVAASALVHAAYNGFVFLSVIIATGGYRHLDRMLH